MDWLKGVGAWIQHNIFGLEDSDVACGVAMTQGQQEASRAGFPVQVDSFTENAILCRELRVSGRDHPVTFGELVGSYWRHF